MLYICRLDFGNSIKTDTIMSMQGFVSRHVGPREEDIREMCRVIGVKNTDELIDKTIPSTIRLRSPLSLPPGISEHEYFRRIRQIAAKNRMWRTYIGMGYYGTVFPAVIQRNILENPSWYTSYTPYQAEISQGRLEALLNFQTAVMELTGMEIANASLLDESTAAAEAMIMLHNSRSREAVKKGANKFFVDNHVFPQTLAVLATRAEPLGIELVPGDYSEMAFDEMTFGVLVQYPAADGEIRDYRPMVEKAREAGVPVVVAADILSLSILTPPGEWGADVVVGSTQRLGLPMGYGGPHAGYFATLEKYKRNIPGRIIGVTVDADGNPAMRMALQTREQHIKRERATSNICTAQALLATMAGMYAVYHGPDGLKEIAGRIHRQTAALCAALEKIGYVNAHRDYFDTLCLKLPEGMTVDHIREKAREAEINFRYIDHQTLGISLDETTTEKDLIDVVGVLARAAGEIPGVQVPLPGGMQFSSVHRRKGEFMQQPVFHRYRSETELMRYIKKLERKDFSLTHSMISLGSCTMKLNAAVELLPLSWPEFGNIHPFVPAEQAEGYHQLFRELGEDLCEITGFPAISFQPNSGAAGEYTGLMVIREYHKNRGEGHRNVVLIPASAHGTNPASAVMAGSRVVVVDCDDHGNVNLESLKKLAEEHRENLSAFMVTYPSTHGVFEEHIREMVNVVHENGGLVYMDGANMNAQVGFTNPAVIGADVCHLNLHKTFAIPHGGGGPGMGPIAVAAHLAEFLPGHPVVKTGGEKGIRAIAAAPWGSASILPISHAYIKLLGGEGLTHVTRLAVLNANYLAASLKNMYKILYTGKKGFVAHEMIVDCRPFKALAGITETDIAKRLMDFGFHAPTLSFPVHGTLMVEPTESESKGELDRFITAMKQIYAEIMEVKDEKTDAEDNVLKNAPHTVTMVCADDWSRPYSRQKAAFPAEWLAENKFWPAVRRVDDAWGDRNLMCSCSAIEEVKQEKTE